MPFVVSIIRAICGSNLSRPRRSRSFRSFDHHSSCFFVPFVVSIICAICGSNLSQPRRSRSLRSFDHLSSCLFVPFVVSIICAICGSNLSQPRRSRSLRSFDHLSSCLFVPFVVSNHPRHLRIKKQGRLPPHNTRPACIFRLSPIFLKNFISLRHNDLRIPATRTKSDFSHETCRFVHG